MLKTKTKYLIVVLGILIAMCLFNINTVQAAEVTEEYAQTLLDMLPNEMQLDIKTIEYEKADKTVSEKIETVWKENGVNPEEIKYACFASHIYNGISANEEDFYKSVIQLNFKGSNSNGIKTKTIQLKYSDYDKYNDNDKNYVKKIKVPNIHLIEADLDYMNTDKEAHISIDKTIANYFTKLINDKSIVIKAESGAGGTDGINAGTEGVGIGIFKDGILYRVDVIAGTDIIPVVNVPDTVTDDKLNEYVINEIKKHYPEYSTHITGISKGCTIDYMQKYAEVEDIYTINVKDEAESLIIIRKDTSSFASTDTKTNIKLEAKEGIIPSNTKLEVIQITEGKTYNTVKSILENVNNFKVFDITLLSDNVKIQPNGNVKISIPIPDNFDTSKLVVYRISDTGNKTKYNVLIENNYATFETNHFSTYVLAEEQENVSTETKKGEKDKTPKTGISTNMYMYIAILTIIGIGITKIIIKENKKC